MFDKADHVAGAVAAVAIFQKRSGTGDEHAVADFNLRSRASGERSWFRFYQPSKAGYKIDGDEFA